MPKLTSQNNISNQDLHIIAENISFGYNNHLILDNVNFEIKRGQYIGIVGANGSGKSTLIKILLNILTPSKGRIIVNDNKSKIGYVPQYINETILDFPATVLEIVQTGRTASKTIWQNYNKRDKEAIKKAINITEISHLINRRFGELSGGERQRVLIARALSTEPSILILDEPNTGVDHHGQEIFYSFIEKLHKDMGLTILLISHDIDTILSETDAVLFFKKGRLKYENTDEFSKDEYIDGENNHGHNHARNHKQNKDNHNYIFN